MTCFGKCHELWHFTTPLERMLAKWTFFPTRARLLCFACPRCLKITEKVSFNNIASEASYVYILSGQKWSNLASFWRPKACGQTELPDGSVLIGQKLVEKAKKEKFKCDILSDFQTPGSSIMHCRKRSNGKISSVINNSYRKLLLLINSRQIEITKTQAGGLQ